MSGSYAPLVEQAAKTYNVDPKLINAVIQTESAWNPKAVSKAGAIGLGQLMPQTASALGVTDPTDPAQNINATAAALSQNLNRFGNVPDALRAYNGGWDPSKWSNSETSAYVPKVAAAYQALSGSSDPMAGQQTAQEGDGDVPLTQILGGKPQASTAPDASGAPDAFTQAFGSMVPPDDSKASSSGAPDAFTQAFGSVLNAPANDADTKPSSFWTNMVAGLQHSVSGSGPVGSTLNRVAQWGDANIPGAQALDNTIGRTADVNQQAVTGSQAGAQAFQQGAGKTWGGTIGNDIGTGVLTAPVAEVAMAPVAGALGAGAGALEAGSVGARLLGAGRNLAAGSGASGIPASVLAASAGGAARGAIASTVAGGSPLTGAEFGAAAGPVGMAVAPLVKGAAGGLARTGNSLLDAIEGNAPKAAAANASAANPLIPGAPTAPGAAPSIDPNAEPAPPAQTISPNLTKSLPNPGVILTQAGADKAANKIIATYAAGGPTDINANPLIPGSNPTLAQATNNPGLAVLERTIMNDPRAANLMQERINQTNGANQQAMLGIAGTPDDISAAEAARDSATSAARNAAFANAQPVDSQPVLDTVDSLIQQNAGRPTVQAPLERLRSELVTRVPDPTVDPETGQPTPGAMIDQPISDPQTLYNVRKFIGDMVSPRAAGTAADGRAAAAQLMQIKPVLDDTIEAGAPGFQKYIQQFDQMSQPINGMQYLQSMNLSDAQGNITLPKLNNAIVSLTKQQNLPGARLADSVTPEQFQALTTLRDSMRRSNLTSINARAYGSPTAQNLGSNALLSALSGNVAHGASIGLGAIGADQALGPVAGLAGMAAGHFAAKAASSVAARSNDMLTQALINKLLNPTAAADAFK